MFFAFHCTYNSGMSFIYIYIGIYLYSGKCLMSPCIAFRPNQSGYRRFLITFSLVELNNFFLFDLIIPVVRGLLYFILFHFAIVTISIIVIRRKSILQDRNYLPGKAICLCRRVRLLFLYTS